MITLGNVKFNPSAVQIAEFHAGRYGGHGDYLWIRFNDGSERVFEQGIDIAYDDIHKAWEALSA